MDLEKLIGEPDPDAIPECLAAFIQALIEGRVRQFAVVFENDQGQICDDFCILSDEANRFAMVGALEVTKADYMGDCIAMRGEFGASDDEDEDSL